MSRRHRAEKRPVLPDAKFKDFKNHVLHVAEGEWGGAADKATEWYANAVDHLRKRQWSKAAYALGVLSHYYGREAGLELREDIDTVLEPNMVISMEPMITIPEGEAGAGGYREHDILLVTEDGATNMTGFPFGPEHNIIAA